MPTTTELKELDRREWALVFVIEDLPVAFTNHPDLVGTKLFEDGRQVVSGLVPPNYSMGIDVQADWQLERTTVEIKIEDLEDRVLDLFRGFDGTEEPLVVSVVPTDDPIADADLHDRHVGTEYIGPAGERNYYPLIPGVTRPRTHVGGDMAAADFGVAPVSEHPAIMDGRRCMIYRIWRDHVTYPDRDAGFVSWRPISEADRMWWGTVRKTGQTIENRTWSISCDGPESWLYRRLGSLSPYDEVLADPVPDMPEEYNEIEVSFYNYIAGTYDDVVVYGSDSINYTDPLTTIDLRNELSSLISTTAAATGPDGEFIDFYEQSASMVFGSSEIRIRIRDFEVGVETTRAAEMNIRAHERVWLTLGYDPNVQAYLPRDDEYYVDFRDGGGGYWIGDFSTMKRSTREELLENANSWDNNGNIRVYKPLYNSGAAILPHDPGNEEVFVDLGLDGGISHTGQLDQPIASDPSDPKIGIIVNGAPQSADTQGLWLFYGKRRFEGEEEIFDEYQVARCAWRRAGGTLAGVAGDPPRIRIVKWEDPRAFGFDRPKLSSPWVTVANDNELQLKVRPLLRVGYGTPDQAGEDAHVLLQRLMLTTGTSTGWTSFSDDPTASLPDTDNEPATGVAGEPNLDAEIEDLGLSIPESMVAPPIDWVGLTESLPNEGIRKAGISFLPGTETETIFRTIMAPRGWAMGLARGQYTPFMYDVVPGALDFGEDSVFQQVQLNLAAKRTDNKKLSLHRIKQTVKAISSKQQYTIDYNGNPLTGALQNKVSMRSPSPSARYQPYPNDQGKALGTRRQSAAEHKVEAPYQRLSGGWVSRTRDLVSWTDRGHYWLHDYPLMDREADRIWPGTRVLITDPQPADPVNGMYGITAASGIVTRVNVTGGGRAVHCTILVDGRSTQIGRVHAPSARGRGYDSDTRRLYVDDDWLGTQDGTLDHALFIEPTGVFNLGGNAIVQVFQWDGFEWAITATGTVETVGITPGDGYIQLVAPGLNGTYRRDDEAVVVFAPYTDQDAPWVLTLFAPISDQDGVWTGGTVMQWA